MGAFRSHAFSVAAVRMRAGAAGRKRPLKYKVSPQTT